MKGKLVAVDLDGTALDQGKRIGNKTLDALLECKRRGIVVAVATARSERNAQQYLEAICPDAAVSSGGALGKVEGREVYRKTIPSKTADDLCAHLAGRKDVRYVTLETDSGYYVNYPREDFPGWEGIDTDFSTPRGEDALKVMADFRPGGNAAEVAKRFPGVMPTAYAGEGWVSFSHPEAEKGKALYAVLREMGIDPMEAVCFGDDMNDMGMLDMCGVPVAMGNAIDAVKEKARYVCPGSDEDGVGIWLWENLLA